MTPAEAVYAAVRKVPAGSVVSYGQVAEMVEGVSVSARVVGQLMAFCPEDVPWQRVVAVDGDLPIGKRDPQLRIVQRRLLEQEGVGFLPDGRVDMERFRWWPEELGGLFGEPPDDERPRNQ